MFSLNSVRVAPGARSALAVACGVALSAFHVGAQAEDAVAPVVVTATRQAVGVTELLSDVTVIDQAQIQRNGAGSIADLLARQPGMQIASNGGPGTVSSFYIRGANSEQTKVLVDGLPINSIDASGSPLRFISLSDVERIEILRGPAATLYGADALGGVIQIFTKRGQKGVKAEGFVGLGTNDTVKSSVRLSGGNELWRFSLQSSHDASDGFSVMRGASLRDADRDGYRNTGTAASLSFLPADGHEVGLSYRRNKGKVELDSWMGNGDYDDRSYFETDQWQVFAKNRILNGWRSTVQYGETSDDQTSYSWDSWLTPPGEVVDVLTTRNKHLSWQNDVTLPLGTALFAVERNEQKAGPADNFVQKPAISNNALLGGWSAHAGGHSWQLNARLDDHSQFGEQSTYGLAYGYQLSEAWRVRMSTGTSFKAPTPYQLYTSYYGVGNIDLQPGEARNREVAVVWERHGHTASATYYLNKVHNLIGGDPVTWQYINVNRARLEGVTLAYSGQVDAWHFNASYDWLNAVNEKTGDRLGRRARHKALLAVQRNWDAGHLGLEWVSVGKRFDTNSETQEMGGYGLLNLTGRYVVTPTLAVEARLDNLLDKRYETAKGFGTPRMGAFVGLRYTPR